jgi:hypothetical protein
MQSLNPATPEQQKYVDHAARYVARAMACYQHELWPEAATNLGSAIESLLRIRFGARIKLAKLIERFDEDPLFDSILVHEEDGKVCSTCSLDEIRKLRNAVHPECWKEATQSDVDRAISLVISLYHTLVRCKQSRVAIFQPSPDSTLSDLEATGVYPEECEGQEAAP